MASKMPNARALLGGHGPRYKPAPPKDEKRARRAPSLTAPAADGLRRALEAMAAAGAAESWNQATRLLLLAPGNRRWALKLMERDCSAAARRNAAAVLEAHAQATQGAGPRTKLLVDRARVIERKLLRRARARLPRFELPPREAPPVMGVRALKDAPCPAAPVVPKAAGAELVASWQPERFGLEGIVCLVRAKAIHARWSAGPQGRQGGLPPRPVMERIVRSDVAATHLANASDAYMWWPEGTPATVTEYLRFYGTPSESPLAVVLSDPDRISCRDAVAAVGRGVPSEAVCAIVEMLMKEGAVLPPTTWASSCSGIDMAYPGAVKATGGRLRYLHASERREPMRAVLKAAHGLCEAQIFRDATSEAAATAPKCGIYFNSADCSEMSSRFHGRSEASVASGAVAAGATLGFLALGRAEVAILENVAGRDVEEALSGVVAALPLYAWRARTVRARADLGLLMDRDRLFLVGLSATAQRRVAARAKARSRPTRRPAATRGESQAESTPVPPAASQASPAAPGALEASAIDEDGAILGELVDTDEVDGTVFVSAAYDVVVLDATVVEPRWRRARAPTAAEARLADAEADASAAAVASEAQARYGTTAAGRRERAERRS